MKRLQLIPIFLLIFLREAICLDYFDPQSPLGNRPRPEQQPPSPFLLSPNSANSNRPTIQQQSPTIYSSGSNQQQYSQHQQSPSRIGQSNQQQFGMPTGTNPQQQQREQGTGIGGSRQQRQQQQNDQQLAFGRGLQFQQQQQQSPRNSSSSNMGSGSSSIPFGNGIGQNPHNPSQNTHQSAGGGNVLVEVQLRSYANPQFRLPGNLLCTCPQNDYNCVQSSPQRVGWNCLTSISVFVLSADADLKFNETAYQSLGQYGQFPFEMAQPSTFQFTLDSQPSAIALLVHNLGARIDVSGHLLDTNAVTVVDYFVYNLTGTQPGGGGGGIGYGNVGGQQGVNLQGKLQGTELTFSYSISCHGAQGADGKSLVGPGCDLACNSSTLTGNTAICVSQKSGYYSLCRWTNGNSQVTNC